MSYEEVYAKAFPFSRVVDGMLDPEMIDGAARILNEATKNRFQVNIIISNQIGGNAP